MQVRNGGLADQERLPASLDEAYTKGVKDTKRKLLFCWLIGALGAAVALAVVPGKKDVRSLVTTTLSAGSVAFVVSVLSERKSG